MHGPIFYGPLRAFPILACSLLISKDEIYGFLEIRCIYGYDILFFGLIVDLYQFFVFHIGSI